MMRYNDQQITRKFADMDNHLCGPGNHRGWSKATTWESLARPMPGHDFHEYNFTRHYFYYGMVDSFEITITQGLRVSRDGQHMRQFIDGINEPVQLHGIAITDMEGNDLNQLQLHIVAMVTDLCDLPATTLGEIQRDIEHHDALVEKQMEARV